MPAISILVILLCISIGYSIYQYKSFYSPSSKESDYEVEKRQVVKQFEKEIDKATNERKNLIEKEIQSFIKTQDEVKSRIQLQMGQLDEELTNKKNDQLRRLAEIEQETINRVDAEAARREQKIQEEQLIYDKKIEAIHQEYEEEQKFINEKRKQLNEELRKAEAKQLEIIEEYKRAEQIRQDKDYYRIVLSDVAISDVKRLRRVADELHNPTVLYKLIYKEYYERPFNEMLGRVIKDCGGVGIYKITNLVNGRVYIGQTRQTFKERWRTHVKRGLKAEPGTMNKLYNAMWEDGAENFSFEVLAKCSAAELNEKEKEYIALFHADTFGYNSTSGGA